MKLELFEKIKPKFDQDQMILTQIFAAFKLNEEVNMQKYTIEQNLDMFNYYPQVAEMLDKAENFPLLLVDGEVTIVGAYPDPEDLTEITGLSFQEVGACADGCENCNCGG